MRQKIAGIYCITSIVDKKCYVGYSTNIKKRWETHKTNLKTNRHTNTHLQAAVNLRGLNTFSFSILEALPQGMTKQKYESIETKWVLHFNSHMSEFGYNKCLPGNYPLREEGQNLTNLNREHTITHYYMCINTKTKEITEVLGREAVNTLTGIAVNKVYDLCAYWNNIGKKKSLHGWRIVRKEEYNPNFDYINFKRQNRPVGRKTWQEYELTRKPRNRNKSKE